MSSYHDRPRFGSDGILGSGRRIVRTLASRWKLLIPLWLVISVLLVSLVFLLPREYRKSATLNVTATQSELQVTLSQQPITAAQLVTQTQDTVRRLNLNSVNLTPDNSATGGEVEVRMESEGRAALDAAPEEVVAAVDEHFRQTHETSMGTAIRGRVANLETQIANEEASLRLLDDQIEATSPADSSDVRAIVRLTVLEGQRQQASSSLAGLRQQLRSSQEDLDNLPELAGEPVSVRLVRESPIREDNRRAPAAAFAVVLAFLAAAAVVLRFAPKRSK